MPANNYARNIETNEIVFFAGPVPLAIPGNRPLDWAFYRTPNCVGQFEGRLIGEDPEARCVRLNHTVNSGQCRVCDARRIAKLGERS